MTSPPKVLITLRRDDECWLGFLGFNRSLYRAVAAFNITTERDEYFWPAFNITAERDEDFGCRKPDVHVL